MWGILYISIYTHTPGGGGGGGADADGGGGAVGDLRGAVVSLDVPFLDPGAGRAGRAGRAGGAALVSFVSRFVVPFVLQIRRMAVQ